MNVENSVTNARQTIGKRLRSMEAHRTWILTLYEMTFTAFKQRLSSQEVSKMYSKIFR